MITRKMIWLDKFCMNAVTGTGKKDGEELTLYVSLQIQIDVDNLRVSWVNRCSPPQMRLLVVCFATPNLSQIEPA